MQKSISPTYIRAQGWSANTLLAEFAKVSPAHVAEGLEWYRTAHTFYSALADDLALELDYVSAVGAMCSIRKRPQVERKAAEKYLRTGDTGGLLPASRNQLARVASGTHPLAAISGDKISRYAQAIMSAGAADVVVVDTWAYRVFAGLSWADTLHPDATLSCEAYAILEDMYKEAARVLRMRPCDLQAILWCYIRGNGK